MFRAVQITQRDDDPENEWKFTFKIDQYSRSPSDIPEVRSPALQLSPATILF